MSDDKKYYYLKLKDNFFDREEITVIESMPNGYKYSNILLKMYLRSLKREGKLMVTDYIPYNLQTLSAVLKHDEDTLRTAIELFKDFRLIEVLDNGQIYMNDIQNFVGLSSTEADRKREYRAKIESEIKELPRGQMSRQMSDKNPPEIELDKEIDINKKDKKVKENIYTDVFEKFFSEYPKGGQTLKPQTFKNFQSLIKKKVNPDELIQAAKNYATDCKVAEVQPPYFKKSSNFLGKDAAYLNYVNSEWIPVKPKFYSQNKQPIDNGMNLPEI